MIGIYLETVALIYHHLIGQAVPELLQVLCQGDVAKNLENHQGLTKLFADMLDFVFEFDYLKVHAYYSGLYVSALTNRIMFH